MGKRIRLSLTSLLFCLAVYAQAQPIYTYAGSGVTGHTDSGGVCTLAQFNHPWGLAFDGSGSLFIADHVNCSIRKISASGVISTYAGNTVMSHTGDGGPASAATMVRPAGIAFDAAGNLYIADGQGNDIRKISASGIISTVAGTDTAGYSGDGGQATAAMLNDPIGVAVDNIGNIYVADSGNNVIRKINTSGVISTFAGTGVSGYSGDGGPAINAKLAGPIGIAADAAGNIFVADNLNNVIRKINTSGTITTFAGNGTAGYSGDTGIATAAQLFLPNSITFDNAGNVYITDEGNNALRKVSAVGIITTVAGNGIAGYSGDGGPATSANMFKPMGVAIDTAKNIYIADYINNVIRVVRTARTGVSDPAFTWWPAAITIYPDPAEDHIQVAASGPGSNDLHLVVENTLGQKLWSAAVVANETKIDVSAFPPGCYIVNCYSEGLKMSSARFIKR
jgi:trimeric autotransporter adhesin